MGLVKAPKGVMRSQARERKQALKRMERKPEKTERRRGGFDSSVGPGVWFDFVPTLGDKDTAKPKTRRQREYLRAARLRRKVEIEVMRLASLRNRQIVYRMRVPTLRLRRKEILYKQEERARLHLIALEQMSSLHGHAQAIGKRDYS